MELLICDARGEEPQLRSFTLTMRAGLAPTVGEALVQAGLASGPEDPGFSRKGAYGVFGKRKEWDSPIYDGDRLELYAPLQIDPKTVRRKRANQNRDAHLKAVAAKRKARRL
jgi:putative ubiquitin-RnfH superfamily antitoxin RatB of RatAB toxin-antitoxin module